MEELENLSEKELLDQESTKECVSPLTGNDQTGKQTGKTNNFCMYLINGSREPQCK